MLPSLHPRHVLGTLLAAAALCLSAGAARAASVTVGSTPVSAPTPSGFLGISLTFSTLPQFVGSDPANVDPAFVNLLHDIAPGQRPVLRIGGESTDWSWVPVKGQPRPAGDSFAITPSWLRLAAATARAMHGQLLLGLNLEADNRTDTVVEARTFLRDIGASNILALELGNEPELYHHFPWYRTASGAAVLGRGPGWSLSQYYAEFDRIANDLPRGVTIAGPASGIGSWLRSLAATLKAEPRIGLVTIHAYPLKHCTASHIVTIPEMLAPSSSYGFVSSLAPYVRIARAAGKPLRIDEMNAITCGGTQGVSDSFASALWMMNTLFAMDRLGAGGINLNVPTHSFNAVLAPVSVNGRIAFHVQPEYYAMMMFERAAPPGSEILGLQGALPSTLSAWATRETSGRVHVVLVNQGTGAATASVRVPGTVGRASVSILHAHGLASTGDVSLNGQSFGQTTSTGLLAGAAVTPTLAPVHGAYPVTVPGASIEMLSFAPRPGALLMSALRDRRGLLSSLLPAW